LTQNHCPEEGGFFQTNRTADLLADAPAGAFGEMTGFGRSEVGGVSGPRWHTTARASERRIRDDPFAGSAEIAPDPRRPQGDSSDGQLDKVHLGPAGRAAKPARASRGEQRPATMVRTLT